MFPPTLLKLCVPSLSCDTCDVKVDKVYVNQLLERASCWNAMEKTTEKCIKLV